MARKDKHSRQLPREEDYDQCVNDAEHCIHMRLKAMKEVNIINDFRHSSSREEAEKIDFIITIAEGKIFNLQAKSGVKEALKHCSSKPDIPCIYFKRRREEKKSGEMTECEVQEVDLKLLTIFMRWLKGETEILA